VEEDNGGSLLRLTPEELIEINGQDQHERRHPWANVEGVYETAQHIFIYLAPAMAEIIPKRLFPAAQEAQQFLQQARQYWQQANPEKQPDLKVKRIPWAMRLTQFDLAPPVWALVVLLLFGALYSVLLVRGFYSMGKFFRQTARPEYSMDYAKLLRQAELMEDKEDWQEAAVLYQRLVALEPKNPAGHLGLGSAYSQREKYAEAETSYRAALALNPQAARAAYGMGYVAYIRAQYAEAEQWFQRCLQQDPEHLSANYFLGRVHQAQGKDTEAAQRFRAVLKENPFSDRAREAQKRLAEMRRRQGTGWFASTAVLPEL
jgi:tetratricopeptide (TPR) repeat protein